jgi:hypothetical protein
MEFCSIASHIMRIRMALDTATWSAIAATASAFAAGASVVCSFLVMRIQRNNLLASVRPELVLDGWRREVVGQGDAERDVIVFSFVKNVGKGSALRVRIDCDFALNNRPIAVMTTIPLSILAPEELREVNGNITIWWKNVPGNGSESKYLPLRIRIFCWDVREVRHETAYHLFVIQGDDSRILGTARK